MEPIYFDYNATTPVDPRVAGAMRPYLEQLFGNPSSIHSYGLGAKNALELARGQVAALLNASPDEIIFTSGGTESNNMAIKGAAMSRKEAGNHIITTVIEHPAVAEVCRYLENNGFRVTRTGVDEDGMVSAADIEKAICPDTILITVMHANNETGTIQPVEEIGRIARERGILFHSDAAQSVGKIPVDVKEMCADLLSVAGHKMYAPKGVGALYIRRGVKIEKLIHGADHEANMRAGTENVPEIVGLGKAAEISRQFLHAVSPGATDPASFQKDLRDMLYDGLRKAIPDLKLNGHPVKRLPNTLSVGFPAIEASQLLAGLKEVAASAGAACHSDQGTVSGVLAAMQVPMEYAMGTIRFSVGRMTTRAEIETAIPAIVQAYDEVKRPETGYGPGTNRGGKGNPDIRLTEYTHSLGCACKIRPQLLEKILGDLPKNSDPRILVGFEHSDDAAVFRISDDQAIVQTVDFIPPVVDDPYQYGAIAAANALSDIYAMGGTPLFALSIVAFPDARLPLGVLNAILQGAHDKTAEAGIQIIGGHSIEDNEPKFGLTVTGIINPEKILKNATARAGDVLILTKPIGTGIITTAIKRGLASPQAAAKAIGQMGRLNNLAAMAIKEMPVNACTDVTGFGLLGHLKEMTVGSGIRAVIDTEAVPVLDEAWAYAAAGAIPGGTKNNLAYVSGIVTWSSGTPDIQKLILADAQTSGGLLIAVPREFKEETLLRLHNAGVREAIIIGQMIDGVPGISV